MITRAAEAKIAKSISFPPPIFALPARFKRHFQIQLYFICATSPFFQLFINFYRNGELPRNRSGRSGVEIKKENEKFTVVCSCSPHCLDLWSFHVVVLQRTQRNGPKSENARTGRLFLLIRPIVLRRCRCRHRSYYS